MTSKARVAARMASEVTARVTGWTVERRARIATRTPFQRKARIAAWVAVLLGGAAGAFGQILSWPAAPTMIMATLAFGVGLSVGCLFYFGLFGLVRLYAALPFTVVLVMGLGFANLALKTGTSLTGPLWARDDADLEAFAYWVFALLFIVAWCGFTLMLLPRFPDRIRLTWFTVGAAVSFALTLAFVGGMASDFEGSSALLDLSFASWFGFVAFASGIVAFSLVYKSHRGEGAVTATGPAD